MANKKMNNDEIVSAILQGITQGLQVGNDDELLEIAKYTFNIFTAYKKAGFTEKQALELTKALIVAGVSK